MGATKSKYSVLLVGLEGVGKTTILYHLRLEEVRVVKPTLGFNYEVIDKVHVKKRFQFHCFDLAGKPNLRPLWKHFYRNIKPHVVLFVVDSNKLRTIDEARKEFQKLLHEVDLLQSLIVVLANRVPGDKREHVDPMKESDIRYKMDVPRDIEVIPINAHELQDITRVMLHISQVLQAKYMFRLRPESKETLGGFAVL